MFACLELLKVSESVARRTGDLSAQVGRRVVCVAPCRLSKPVQAKSARRTGDLSAQVGRRVMCVAPSRRPTDG